MRMWYLQNDAEYCAFNEIRKDCNMSITGTICISKEGECGTGVEVDGDNSDLID